MYSNNKLNKLQKNKNAGAGDIIADIMIVAIIIFIIAVFFVFFVKFAAKETKLDLEANRIKLDLTYDLLQYLRSPVADGSGKTVAEAIESYLATKTQLDYEQLKQFYEETIMKSSSRCKLIRIEKKSSNEQITLGSCKIAAPLRSQVMLPLYDSNEYAIVEYSIDITSEVTEEVIKKYFNVINHDEEKQ